MKMAWFWLGVFIFASNVVLAFMQLYFGNWLEAAMNGLAAAVMVPALQSLMRRRRHQQFINELNRIRANHGLPPFDL